jgi:CAAX protease family protein
LEKIVDHKRGQYSKAAIFYGIALSLALLVSVAAPWLGEGSRLVTMLTPAISVIIMVLFFAPESGRHSALVFLGLSRAGWRGYSFAIGMPILLLVISYSIVWLTDIASFRPPTIVGSLFFVLVNLAIGLAISTALAMCEEVGWRGYMLPRLLGIGIAPAMLLVGLLHGVWHLPLMLATPYYHSEGSTFLVVPLFLVTLTLAGVVFGFLRIWTASVWPVAIAHGVFNWTWELLNDLSQIKLPAVFEYVGGESGVLVIVGLALVAAALFRRMQSHQFRVTALALPVE